MQQRLLKLLQPNLYTLAFLLLVKALWATLTIINSNVYLAPDEAQYWTWSQALDWGYYSKPPGIAWQIHLGTLLFGNTELGVRFSSVILSALMCIALYLVARANSLSKTASFWAGIALSLSPIGIMGSFAATTDGGFIFFWILAAGTYAKFLNTDEKENATVPLPLITTFIICGSLFKWAIYWLWLPILAFTLIYHRATIKKLVASIFISFLGLLPSVIWNAKNDWATFKHVWYTIVKASIRQEQVAKPLLSGNFLEFVGAQFGVLSPIFMALLLITLTQVILRPKKYSRGLLFCAWTCAAILIFNSTASLFNKMQANWAVYAYPTGIIVMGHYACEQMKNGRRWLTGGALFSLLLSLLTIHIPLIQERDLLKSNPIPYKLNPFRHNMGWKQLSTALDNSGFNPDKHFLFADRYQNSSILSFYNSAQKRAYFFNIEQARKNQFSYWPNMADEQIGQTGYFVTVANDPEFERELEWRIKHYNSMLKPFFRKVEFLGIHPLFWANGQAAKGAWIFKCHGYNGDAPPEVDKY